MSSSSKSKSEIIYDELRSGILSGRYTPGYRLVLKTVADSFGVSSVPVREAVRRLEAEGLVEFTRNVGARVSEIDVYSYSDSMNVLAYLEGAATALAAQHATDEQLAEAEALNMEMKAAAEGDTYDPVAYAARNAKFHQVLCRSCPNAHLLALLETETERVEFLRRGEFRFNPTRSRRSVAQHEELIRLIRAGADPLEIERVARDHKISALYDSVGAAVERRPDTPTPRSGSDDSQKIA